MNTPDTVGAINRITTPFHDRILSVSGQGTASTPTFNFESSSVNMASDDEDEDNSQQGPTFDVCSRTIMAAADRMMALSRQPHSLTVAIAYDECLDIVTAATNHLEHIGKRSLVGDNIVEVYQAMRSIHELLRPSPPVRRALQF